MHTPVVFVHGTTVDGSCWDDTIEHLVDEGFNPYRLHAITFENTRGEPHHRMSEQLDSFVARVREENDSDTIHIVGHSLGATGTRFWLEDKDRYDWVDTAVYMAGAMHGTHACNLAPFVDEDLAEPCARISTDAMQDEENLLAQLNRGESECPEGVRHYTIRATFDRYYVTNPTSPRLDGAEANHVIPTTHRGLLRHKDTHERLAEWLS